MWIESVRVIYFIIMTASRWLGASQTHHTLTESHLHKPVLRAQQQHSHEEEKPDSGRYARQMEHLTELPGLKAKEYMTTNFIFYNHEGVMEETLLQRGRGNVKIKVTHTEAMLNITNKIKL